MPKIPYRMKIIQTSPYSTVKWYTEFIEQQDKIYNGLRDILFIGSKHLICLCIQDLNVNHIKSSLQAKSSALNFNKINWKLETFSKLPLIRDELSINFFVIQVIDIFVDIFTLRSILLFCFSFWSWSTMRFAPSRQLLSCFDKFQSILIEKVESRQSFQLWDSISVCQGIPWLFNSRICYS